MFCFVILLPWGGGVRATKKTPKYATAYVAINVLHLFVGCELTKCSLQHLNLYVHSKSGVGG